MENLEVLFNETIDGDNKTALLDALRDDNAKEYCIIFIENSDYPEYEYIINRKDNFIHKSNYYEAAYNDKLVLNNCDKIRITFAAMFDSLDQLSDVLILGETL